MDRIFLIQNNKLTTLDEAPYEKEDILQKLLVDHPQLLYLKHPRENRSLHFALVERECGIPDSKETSNRWSIDHLFVDEEGVPTFVEVKRSSDTRIRREVVGQLIEYAANALSFWQEGYIRNALDNQAMSLGISIEEYVKNFLGCDDLDELLQNIKSNFQSGKIRMVIVADAIPHEMQTIIEFLNEQMDPAEFLGLEIPQFSLEGIQTIIPKTIGQTAASASKKGATGYTREKKQWDEPSFFKKADESLPEKQAQTIKSLLEFLKLKCDDIRWCQGAVNAAFIADCIKDDIRYQILRVDTSGKTELVLDFINQKPAFIGRDIFTEVGLKIKGLLPEHYVEGAKHPSVSTAALTDPKTLESWKEVICWMCDQARSN